MNDLRAFCIESLTVGWERYSGYSLFRDFVVHLSFVKKMCRTGGGVSGQTIPGDCLAKQQL